MSFFHFFEALPLKLRRMIWQATLPERVPLALYFYRDGLWCGRRLAESETQYLNRRYEWGIEFQTRLLERDECVPLVSVNKEARGIALEYVHKNGLFIKHEPRGSILFTRAFDCVADALYIPDDRWTDFCREAERCNGGGYQRRRIFSDLSKIAISETLFSQGEWSEGLALADLTVYYSSLKVLYVVVGSQPDGTHRPWCGELHGTDEEALVWESKRGKFSLVRAPGMPDNEEIWRKIEKAAHGDLCKELSFWGVSRLEIRPIFVTQR